ncbi:MAG: hypothetical protein AAGA00_16105 [Pseudomonadota bacterium]
MKKLIMAALMPALFSLPASAEGFSWNGSYEGHFVCDDVTAGSAGGFSRPFKAQIIQDGSDIDMAISAVVDPATGESPSLYRGKLQETAGGTVMSGYLEVCSGRFLYKELVRIFPATASGTSFSFAGDTIFITEALPGAEGKLVVESCKWALKRVSVETPDFKTCQK